MKEEKSRLLGKKGVGKWEKGRKCKRREDMEVKNRLTVQSKYHPLSISVLG